MSVRVFNKKWKRRLEANGDSKDFIILDAYAFADVPEKYTGDITFQKGAEAGDIEVIITAKQGEAAEAKAHEKAEEAEEPDEPAKKSRSKK